MYLTTKTAHFIKLDKHNVQRTLNIFINISLFRLFLIGFLIVLNDVKPQTIVTDYLVRGDSLYLEPMRPIIASDSNNNFLVIYTLYDQRPHAPLGFLWGQQYNANGIIMNERFYIGENIGSSAIDMNESGVFIVCWSRSNEVLFWINNSNYKVIDSNNVVGFGYSPDVIIDETGNFIITWVNLDTIYCQRYTSDGEAVGNKIKVSDNPNGTRSSFPRIGADNTGNFGIVWKNSKDDTIHTYYQRYNSNGEPMGSNIRIYGNNSEMHQINPLLVVNKTGDFVIVWMEELNGNEDIYYQLFNSYGALVGNILKVNDDSNNSHQEYPAIDIGESGEVIITWQDDRNGNWDIYAQRFNSSGEAIGNNFRINHMEESDQKLPDVTLKNGRIYSTWQVYDGTQNSGVWANVLDFDNPVGVDSPEIENQVPKIFKLNQNYPNPFNPETTIEYELPYQSFILLKIYNMLGQEVRTLVKEHQQAGVKTVIWNGESNTGMQVPSGIYIYRMEADRFVKTQKMILIR